MNELYDKGIGWMILFKKQEEKALLRNPLRGFEIDSQPIEYLQNHSLQREPER